MDEKEFGPKPIDLENNHPVVDDLEPLRDNDLYQEETASELVDHDVMAHEDTDVNDSDLHNVYGWTSIGLSVISFFLLPFILAVAGIVVGFIARSKAAPILGNTAIVIGALSIIVRLFILPLI